MVDIEAARRAVAYEMYLYRTAQCVSSVAPFTGGLLDSWPGTLVDAWALLAAEHDVVTAAWAHDGYHFDRGNLWRVTDDGRARVPEQSEQRRR